MEHEPKKKSHDFSVSINAPDVDIHDQTNRGGLLKCNCCRKQTDHSYQQFEASATYVCRRGFCCKWCCIILATFLALFLIILYAWYIPNTAQTLMDNSSLIQLYTSILDPSADSITLNTTLQIVNTGGFDAIVDSADAQLLYNGEQIGVFMQPSINLKGGLGATFNLLTKVTMSTDKERKLFQNVTRKLLRGNDMILSIVATPKIHIQLMNIKVGSTTVNLNKDLVIPGTRMQNPYIREFNVKSTPNATVVAISTAEIEFSISSTLHVFAGDAKMNISDSYGNHLGYTMQTLSLVPGYNKVSNITTILHACNCSNTSQSNVAAILAFVGNYENGVNQILNMRGPLKGLVISDTINEDALVYGYHAPS